MYPRQALAAVEEWLRLGQVRLFYTTNQHTAYNKHNGMKLNLLNLRR